MAELINRVNAYFRKIYGKINNRNDMERKLFSKGSKLSIRIFRFILLSCMCFVVLYPIVYMVSISVRDPRDLYDPTIIWVPKHWTLSNFSTLLGTLNYFKLLVNTVIIASIGTVLNVISCSLAGYGFAKFKFKLRNLAFAMVLFTIIIPPQNVSIPLYMQYRQFDYFGIGQFFGLFIGQPLTTNLLNTPFTLYIPAALGMGIRSGLFIYIFRQFFRGMPKELEDAAYIDGCGIMKTFVKIILPNAVPAIVSCVLFSFVWYWNDFFLTSMYFNEPQTLSTALATLQDTLRSMGFDFYSNPFIIVTQMQAACIMTIAPLLIIYIFLQRFFTESIERTGIVG